jgi:hypothetical protein
LQLSNYYEDFTEAMLKCIGVDIKIIQEAKVNRGQMIAVKIENFVIKTNVEDAFNRLIRDPLKGIFEIQYPHPEIFIMVDGLDEALTFGRINIVTLLAGSNDLPANVRFLLTSRNEPKVLDQFLKKRVINLSSIEHTIEVNDDIRGYLDKRFEEKTIKSKIASTKNPQEIKDNLIERVAGNFLYVRFLLDEVAAGKRSLEDLASFPRDLFGLYRNYLDRLIPEMLQIGMSQTWIEKFQPMLGCLSVAMPSVSLEVLSEWLERRPFEVAHLLNEVMQIVENDPANDGGFRLYHRSIADFLATATISEGGSLIQNRFWTPPRDQHERIIRYYLRTFENWEGCDKYGLRRLVAHMQTMLSLERKPEERRKQAQDLFSLVLNEGFQLAQQEGLGEKGATLADLRTALDVALSRHDLAKAINCIGVYRDKIIGRGVAQQAQGNSVAQDIFEAVDAGDIEKALKDAEIYHSIQDWASVLHFYLAWEAAELGNVDATLKALDIANHLSLQYLNKLSDAFVAHTARKLSHTVKDATDAVEWFAKISLGKEPNSNLVPYDIAQPPPESDRQNLRDELNREIDRLTQSVDNGDAESPSNMPLFDAEGVSLLAGSLKDLLTKISADPLVWPSIDRILQLVLNNPYPRYRDIALEALTIACLSVPNQLWVRERLRAIFQTTLNREGITFTFDFPSMLLFEAKQRKLPVAEIEEYINRVAATQDRWCTSQRLHNAFAAAHFRQDNKEMAFDELKKAAQQPRGYAGYTTVSWLSIATRWLEFGFKEKAIEIINQAISQASYIRDPDFRMARMKVANFYYEWLHQETPKVEDALTTLASIVDQDTRMAYIDHVSARWCSNNNWTGLETLLSSALGDATTMDALLGRLFGLRLHELSDDDLKEAFLVCSRYFTTARPWELGKWQMKIFEAM